MELIVSNLLTPMVLPYLLGLIAGKKGLLPTSG